ncbi:family 43 glycosylhydrolase [Phocaeicola dorei]|nr:family 43 glycosylhydrolase [Phocaeicola dorei]
MMGETIIPDSISNPIRTGFHPDPSICRVGEDYYLVTSSFTWFPGLPIYHSRDLANWSLIGHALTNPKAIDFSGMTDNDGIWPPLYVIIMEHSILSPQLMAVVAISI